MSNDLVRDSIILHQHPKKHLNIHFKRYWAIVFRFHFSKQYSDLVFHSESLHTWTKHQKQNETKKQTKYSNNKSLSCAIARSLVFVLAASLLLEFGLIDTNDESAHKHARKWKHTETRTRARAHTQTWTPLFSFWRKLFRTRERERESGRARAAKRQQRIISILVCSVIEF